MVLAAGLATLGGLPVFLLGALAVLIRTDLEFSRAKLGIAVAIFFALAALGSFPAGRLADRFGARHSLRAGVGITATGLAGMALAQDWAQLTLALGFTGLGHAVIQVAANLLLSHAVPERAQGLAFGIKQSAIPFATLLAGLAVPLVALTVGWRWVYAGAAATAVCCVLGQLRGSRTTAVRSNSSTGDVRLPRRELLILAVGVGLGAAAANALGTFLVTFVTDIGQPVGQAGALLATISLAGIVTRIAVGRLADLRSGIDLRGVSALMGLGAIAMLTLAVIDEPSPVLWIASGLGFAGGWGWPGLLTFIVAKDNAHAPAAATGLTQSGIFAGAVAGPLLFGFAVSSLSYDAAWTGAAVALLVGSVLVLIARRYAASPAGRRIRR